MILKYYNGYVSLNKLEIMLNVNQNGTSAYNIKKTLETLGFKSYGIKQDNLSYLKLPCIAHVIIESSYTHYVVIYKVDEKRKKLLIADPAKGLKKISFIDFKKIWTNITIQMRPEKKIILDQEPKIHSFVLKTLKGFGKNIFLIYFLSLLENIISLSIVNLVSKQNLSFISNNRMFFKMLLALSFLRIILVFIKQILFINFNLKLDKKMSSNLFKKILNLPYRYYKRKTTGEIISYMNDLYIIRNAINQFISVCLIDIPLIIILTVILSTLNFKYLLIIILYLIVTWIISRCYDKGNVQTMQMQIEKNAYNSYVAENIMGFETIQNLNIPLKIYKKFTKKQNSFINCNQNLAKKEAKINLLNKIVQTLCLIMIISNQGSIKELITPLILSGILTSTIQKVLNNNYQINQVTSALSNISELTVQKSENKQRKVAKGNIEIQNLSFSFDQYNDVLKNINLKIYQKNKILVTGDSGSGKSTLFKIIKGYYNDYKGSVKIGKNEVKKCKINKIIYISQKELLFTGTLKDNLNIIKKTKWSKKICEINQFAQNDYTIIEEDGFNLSGGQKQRIALARALCNFNILIIDEALNQVSIDMERRILKNILQKFKNKTIIYISHRLDNLDLFDRFIKMQNGQIIIDEKRNN